MRIKTAHPQLPDREDSFRAVAWRTAPPVLAALIFLTGCVDQDTPTAPPTEQQTDASRSLSLRTDPLPVSVGAAWTGSPGPWSPRAGGPLEWRWFAGAANRDGRASLTWDAHGFRWRLPSEIPPGPLRLVPADHRWLPITVPGAADLATHPPLPRIPVRSAAYGHLVALIRDLMTPRFDGIVTHWTRRPVPVSAPDDAISGEVDLAACLREAVDSWNAGEEEPFFVWDPGASWGIRLAHYAGSLRSPPLQTQLTRRDAEGRALRVRIAVGDDYASEAARPYAVRGLAHELGHALLLWGHSPDRQHLLWGDAPPLCSAPSPDERRAVRLRQWLPHGLDLRAYGD